MITQVIGLGFGDEGKGSIIDYLVRKERPRLKKSPGLVVRWNGGPQAAHHVVSPEGVRHCFAQFGSGTLVPGVRTLLAKGMLIEPMALLREAEVLREKGIGDALARLAVDERSVVVTPFHRALNRMRELARGVGRHGTCGLGVGEARLDAESGVLPALRVGDLRHRQRTRKILQQIQQIKIDHAEQLLDAHPASVELKQHLTKIRDRGLVDDLLAAYGVFVKASKSQGLRILDAEEVRKLLRAEPLVFEGAQGALLDRDRGFWPHVTPSSTGFEHADELLAEADISDPVRRFGVIRAYATRHGAGPLVSEDVELEARLPEMDNRDDGWPGRFRCGSFDAVMLRYALRSVGGVDGLALTNLDRLSGWQEVPFCAAYSPPEESRERLEELFEMGSERQIVDLLVPPEAEREHQRKLAEALGGCGPRLELMSGWSTSDSPAVEAFIRKVEDECGSPVLVRSWGPSSIEKQSSS